MLIFDGFASREQAEKFAAHMLAECGKAATVYDSQEESDAIDPFPFVLTPPIVLVQRDDDLKTEQTMQELVNQFGGQFAGT